MTHSPNSYQRRLNLEGSPNVRDLGGYPTRDGGRVRWGRLLRAGRLSALTPRDQSTLSRYQLRVVCDFRQPEEYERDRSKLEGLNGLSVHNLPIVPGSHGGSPRDGATHDMTPEAINNFMVQVNRELALHQTEAYRRMFELLLDIDDGGFLFHCSAGKDRTGFAAAVILSALGVERETIMEDYLLTAHYYPASGEVEHLASRYLGREPTDSDRLFFKAMMDTREQYLDAAFQAIEEHYSSMDAYLEQALGVCSRKRERLMTRYVE